MNIFSYYYTYIIDCFHRESQYDYEKIMQRWAIFLAHYVCKRLKTVGFQALPGANVGQNFDNF